jgi:hypothetical protein
MTKAKSKKSRQDPGGPPVPIGHNSEGALYLPHTDFPQARPTPWDPTIQKAIRRVIRDFKMDDLPFAGEDVIVEIMVTALKAVQSQLGMGDLKLLSRTVRELRYAFKIFKDFRSVRKISIFGSARTSPHEKEYKMARAFAEKLTQHGYMVITGAGPGIMRAGNEGAGPYNSFGINIRLPFEQEPNKFIARQRTYIDCKYFFTRKLVFVKEASGAVFFPGGFGTLDEAFELFTLVQTGKANPIPIILMDPKKNKYWKTLDRFIHTYLIGGKKISPEDVHLYTIVHNHEEAAEKIFQFYSNYHSMRYVGKKLVIRTLRPIEKQSLHYINKHFRDIITSGRFHKSNALNEESNQLEIQHLPRLVFNFNRINNGRLRELIDFINKQ